MRNVELEKWPYLFSFISSSSSRIFEYDEREDECLPRTITRIAVETCISSSVHFIVARQSMDEHRDPTHDLTATSEMLCTKSVSQFHLNRIRTISVDVGRCVFHLPMNRIASDTDNGRRSSSVCLSLSSHTVNSEVRYSSADAISTYRWYEQECSSSTSLIDWSATGWCDERCEKIDWCRVHLGRCQVFEETDPVHARWTSIRSSIMSLVLIESFADHFSSSLHRNRVESVANFPFTLLCQGSFWSDENSLTSASLLPSRVYRTNPWFSLNTVVKELVWSDDFTCDAIKYQGISVILLI